MIEEGNIGQKYLDGEENDKNFNQQNNGEIGEGKENEPQEQPNLDGGPTGREEDENSFHIDKCLEKVYRNPKFSEREQKINDRIDDLVHKVTQKPVFKNYIFLVNKILLFTTLSEFLFQRFDIVTLLLCVVIILIEIGVFTYKHLYKWIFVLIGSILLDSFVLIDVAPVNIFFNFIYRRGMLI